MRPAFASSLSLILLACGPKPAGTASDTADDSTATGTATTGEPPSTTSAPTTSATTDTPTSVSTSGLDIGGPTTGEPAECTTPGGCNRLDLLIVVDNSGAMADEQKQFVAALPHLVERLRGLVDAGGVSIEPDVQVMVTTTDMSHPLCAPFEKLGYDPAMGAPIDTACADRLERFTALGGNPLMRPDVCLDTCPKDQVAVPADPFVAFAGDQHNVVTEAMVADPVVAALQCVAPQGIDGCGMEAPLEAMLQALGADKPWNDRAAPFLRPGAALGIVLLTDETDCSVEDFAHFDPKNANNPEFNQFWEDDPGQPGVKDEPTSAICWNSSMTCEDVDADGVYESCVPEDKGVLLPLSRYTQLLVDELAGAQQKPVFMLVIGGVPTTGIDDLVHRGWLPDDIMPGDSDTPAQKEFDFGIGPGCSSPATGNALPPGRIAELCRALDVADDPNTAEDESQVRCCFESACAAAPTGGFDCLADGLAQVLRAG